MKQTIVAALVMAAAGAAVAAQAIKVEPTPTAGASSPRAEPVKPAPKAGDKKEAPKK